MNKEFKVKLSYRSSVWITEEMCTQDPIQAMMKVAELSHSVEDTMNPNGITPFEYRVWIEVRNIKDSEIRSPAIGVWYGCSINGEPCTQEELFPYGLFPDGYTAPNKGELPHQYAAPVPAYKVAGKLFETWYDVIEEYPGPNR